MGDTASSPTARPSVRTRRAGRVTVLAIGLAVGSIVYGGCAHRAKPGDGFEQRLARLAAEQEALRAELARLRASLDSAGFPDGSGTPAGTEGVAEAVPERVAPEPTISALLESYRSALQNYDRDRLEGEVYGGEIPEEDARYLRIWLESTTDLSVALEALDLVSEGGRVRVTVRQLMRYRLRRTGRDRRAQLTLTLTFEPLAQGWRLADLEARD